MLGTPLQSFLDGSSFLIIEGRESLLVLLLLTRRHALTCCPGRRHTGNGGQHLRPKVKIETCFREFWLESKHVTRLVN